MNSALELGFRVKLKNSNLHQKIQLIENNNPSMKDIPNEKIKEGYEKSKQHIKSLLKASEILFREKQYSTSLSYSILAREELAKLKLIQDHLRAGTGIPEKEWTELTRGRVHKLKLGETAKTARKTVQASSKEIWDNLEAERKKMGLPSEMTYEQAMSLNEDYEKGYEILDRIKQECFYLNWDCGWSTFSTKLSSKKLEEGLSEYHLIGVQSEYYSMISIRMLGEIKTSIQEMLKDDPNFKKWLEINKYKTSSKYKKTLLLAREAAKKFQ